MQNGSMRFTREGCYRYYYCCYYYCWWNYYHYHYHHYHHHHTTTASSVHSWHGVFVFARSRPIGRRLSISSVRLHPSLLSSFVCLRHTGRTARRTTTQGGGWCSRQTCPGGHPGQCPARQARQARGAPARPTHRTSSATAFRRPSRRRKRRKKRK